MATILGLIGGSVRLIKPTKYIAYILGLVAVVAACIYFWLSQPLEFERRYLEQSNINSSDLTLRQQAERLGFFVGAATDDLSELNSELFENSFNSVTAGYSMKLGHLIDQPDDPKYNFKAADELVNTALSKGIRVRGHTLVWGKLSSVHKRPDLEVWLETYPRSERGKRLQELVDNQIEKVLNHYRGRVLEWDVVNEPIEVFFGAKLEANVFYKYLGEKYVENALRKAHEVDPNIELFVNEQFTSYSSKRAQFFYDYIKSLIDDGVPIHGIGLQNHMAFSLESPEEIAKYIKRFTELGLRVELTEFDARLRLFKNDPDPYLAQGRYYRDVLEACIKIPGFTGITYWGYSDRNSFYDEQDWLFFKPNEPMLLDAQLNPKPAYRLIEEFLDSISNERVGVSKIRQ